ncbi:hypothetical protein [Microbispora rosea]|uniref:hypothetical protein n=1 Tax=Microbispora rosea TaxID=58117 RepID=UPI0037B3EE90
MYFSECFGIEYDDNFDWFDPILEHDTPLFVDPFLIFSDTHEHWRSAHDEMMDYFQEAFMILARSRLAPSHQFYKRVVALMEFPEPKEFRLGYTGSSANGSGSGPGLAERITRAMAEAIKRGMDDIRHFEELGILVENINRDRISDVTCNLLKPKLIEYTQNICHSLGIPMRVASIPHGRYDVRRKRWMSEDYLVPFAPESDEPILLVPKRFLGELPALSSDNWMDFLDTSLRDDLNFYISDNMRKADIVALARRRPESVRKWVDAVEREGASPYDVDSDPKLLVKWQKVARVAASEAPFREGLSISSHDDLLRFAQECVEKFRHWVEDKAGWRVFWKDQRALRSIPETSMQLLFLGVLYVYCEQFEVTLDREVETGRGPVDFTFTAAGHLRVLLEMKKLSHGRFWNGLHAQTPIYMKSQKVSHAIFLVVRDSDSRDMHKRWASLDAEAQAVSALNNCKIEIERVDILPKSSASRD